MRYKQMLRSMWALVLISALLGIGWGPASPVAAAGKAKGKDQGKITICHKPGTDYEMTLNVSVAALKAHKNHGDGLGSCLAEGESESAGQGEEPDPTPEPAPTPDMCTDLNGLQLAYSAVPYIDTVLPYTGTGLKHSQTVWVYVHNNDSYSNPMYFEISGDSGALTFKSASVSAKSGTSSFKLANVSDPGGYTDFALEVSSVFPVKNGVTITFACE